jgi:hypothetical protein
MPDVIVRGKGIMAVHAAISFNPAKIFIRAQSRPIHFSAIHFDAPHIIIRTETPAIYFARL